MVYFERQSEKTFLFETTLKFLELKWSAALELGKLRSDLKTMPVKVITDQRCAEYSKMGHPERPARVVKTVEKLKEQREVEIEWGEPEVINEDTLLRVHSIELVNEVKNPTGDFDPDTPAYTGIYGHALRSAAGALSAARSAIDGKIAFSLMRPPGHHATRHRAMGFCYFNNIAIATKILMEDFGLKVGVFDFDLHHGNGTEEILLNQKNTAFFSVHEFPHYPGTGGANVGNNCFNYPVSSHAPRRAYLDKLRQALDDLGKFDPDVIAVSAGFDGYKNDPLGTESLEIEDYYWLGQSLKKIGKPIFCVLEGGYSSELPELILAFLRGLKDEK